MWLVIGALAAVALGISLTRNATRQAPGEAVAFVAGAESATETVTRSQCLARSGRVWVAPEDGGVQCLAYIASDSITAGTTAVLYIEGDAPDEDFAPGRMEQMIAAYQRRVTAAQSYFGLPVIVIARPGLMGSSGVHVVGGMRDEAQIMSAAVDALKERYGFRRMALAGQSGGARLIAQLLVLGRRDILCAAMGSGAYGVPLTTRGGRIRTDIFGDPGRKFLVPLQHAEDIVSAPERRAFVIGDPRDKRTPFPGQREWAEKLQTLGHHAMVLEGSASDPEHHGLGDVALQVAAMCAIGKSDQEIAAQVAAGRLLHR
jgi:hypothetical protein